MKYRWSWLSSVLTMKAVHCRQDNDLIPNLPGYGVLGDGMLWDEWSDYLSILGWILHEKLYYIHIHIYTGRGDLEDARYLFTSYCSLIIPHCKMNYISMERS